MPRPSTPAPARPPARPGTPVAVAASATAAACAWGVWGPGDAVAVLVWCGLIALAVQALRYERAKAAAEYEAIDARHRADEALRGGRR